MARHNLIFAGPFTEATPQIKEGAAGAAIMPGSVIVGSIVAGVFTFNLAAPGATGQLFVAREDTHTTSPVTKAIAVGDNVQGINLMDEQFLNILLPTGVNVAEGDALYLAAGGKVSKVAGRLVGYAEETFNNTTDADQLIRVRTGNHAAPAA